MFTKVIFKDILLLREDAVAAGSLYVLFSNTAKIRTLTGSMEGLSGRERGRLVVL